MQRTTRLGQLKRLAFVLLLSTILLCLIIAVSLFKDYHDDKKNYLHGLFEATASVESATNNFFNEYLAAFRAVSQMSCVKEEDTAACNPVFEGLNRTFPDAVNFAALDRDGYFFTSGKPFDIDNPPSIRGLDFYEAIMQGAEKFIMAPHIGPISGEYVTGMTIPLKDASGEITGSTGASIKLSALKKVWEKTLSGSKASMLIVDSNNVIHMAPPALEEFIGKDLDRLIGLDALPFGVTGNVSLGPNEYAALAKNLKSSGYTIIALMHPYDLSSFVVLHKEIKHFGLPTMALFLAALFFFVKERFALTMAHESEDRHRSLFASANDGIVLIDNETGAVLDCNTEFERQTGRTLAELKNMKIWELVPPDKTEQAKKVYKEISEAGQGGSSDLGLLRPDGNITHIEFKSSMLDIDGKVYRQSISRDITERRQAEKTLRQTKEALSRGSEFLNKIIDLNPYPISIYSPSGHYIRSNDSFIKMFGTTPPEGYSVFEDPIAERSGFTADVQEKVRNGETVQLERFFFNTRDLSADLPDNPLFFNVTIFSIFSTDNKIESFVLIFDDISERVKADDALRLSKDTLSKSLKEKEILLQEVHHRVKNNMAVISSMLSLQAGNLEEKKLVQMLNESRSRIMSMALVHEKLYQSEDFVHVNLNEYFHSLTQSIKWTFAEDSPVKIILGIDDVVLNLDQIIPCGLIANELITNSMKHGLVGTENPEINVGLTMPGDDMVSLRVSDNGVGLPEGFDTSGSTGLGFKLISALADQLNGEIMSGNDGGAWFDLKFPLKTSV